MIRPVRSLLISVEGVFDRLLCVVGGALFSQLPEFIQQYLQRLGGHLDEARRQLEQFQNVAAQSHVSLHQFIVQTQGSNEPTVAQLGRVMQATVERVHDLAAAEAAIRGASLFTRPWEFFRHLDFSIAHATWAVFKPAVPTTVEGLGYAVIGVLLTLVMYHGAVRYPVRRAWRRRHPVESAAAAPTGAPTPRPAAPVPEPEENRGSAPDGDTGG